MCFPVLMIDVLGVFWYTVATQERFCLRRRSFLMKFTIDGFVKSEYRQSTEVYIVSRTRKLNPMEGSGRDVFHNDMAPPFAIYVFFSQCKPPFINLSFL